MKQTVGVIDIFNSSLSLTQTGERPNPARMSGYLTVQHLEIIALHDTCWYQCNMLFFYPAHVNKGVMSPSGDVK